MIDVDRWLAETENVPEARAPRSTLVELRATIRGLEAENARLREALSKLAKIGLAIRSAGPWTKRDAWPEFFDAVDEADALAEQAS